MKKIKLILLIGYYNSLLKYINLNNTFDQNNFKIIDIYIRS